MKKYKLIFALHLLFSAFVFSQKINTNTKILVLFHSETGNTYKMAKAIAQGIQKLEDTEVFIKQIPNIEKNNKLSNVPIANIEELPDYDAIAFGSPVHFANMSADLHYFLNQGLNIWAKRKLEGKPATVFMSAGSGAGRETAILSLWNLIASHGMVIVPTGLMGTENIDKTIPQGNTPFGASSLNSYPGERPTKSELNVAIEQGYNLAKIAKSLKNNSKKEPIENNNISMKNDVYSELKNLNIELPNAPNPVGNYVPYVISNQQVYINQVSLLNGKILNPGKIGKDITEEQAKQATKQTILNILSVLNQATDGDLNRVKRVVQLTGFFNADENFINHANIMNTASDLMVKIFKDKGKHARATVGAYSLPLNAPVEIQAIFELE